MDLTAIYSPIEKELKDVESALGQAFAESEYQQIVEIGEFLMSSPGKRLRPALVLLTANLTGANKSVSYDRKKLISVAAAIELIHIASLIHDDVVDKAPMRHKCATINARWGDEVSLIFGDYIYSKAFRMISDCRNIDVLSSISEAVHVMSEGELRQILKRNVLELPELSYSEIAEKKTAAFFAACCRIGSILAGNDNASDDSAKRFGMEFGVAFQIADDMKDIVCGKLSLGKHPGQDMLMGEMTLPLMNLVECADLYDKDKLTALLGSEPNEQTLSQVRQLFLGSKAHIETSKTIAGHIECAKKALSQFDDSTYRSSLIRIADSIAETTVQHT